MKFKLSLDTSWKLSKPPNVPILTFVGGCVLCSSVVAQPILNPANRHYYEQINGPAMDWDGASADAAARSFNDLPGHLVTITSVAEEQFLTSSFPDITSPVVIYLGATDRGVEDEWKWVTGEPWQYENWGPGEPDGGEAANCLQFSPVVAVEWSDNVCGVNVGVTRWIVEYEERRPSMVLHLALDDGTPSSIASDSSGNGLDGELFNMDPNTVWQVGVAGMALDFDGSNDYVELPDVDALDFAGGDFTVSYWYFKQATTAGFDNLYGVSKWSTGASPGTNEWLLNPGSGIASDAPKFNVVIGNTIYEALSPVELPLFQWHHLVGVRRGNTTSLYVDGVLAAVNDTLPVGGLINNVGKKLRLAANQPSAPIFYSNLMIDDLQIYAYAASDGGVGVGEVAGGEVRYLFENPGSQIGIFSDGFESGDVSSWSSSVP